MATATTDDGTPLVGPAYSSRLGRIAPARFQAALDRFGLGRFVAAAPARGGNFGQVLFLASTTGAWVLRGAPPYPARFREERFFRPAPPRAGARTEPVALPAGRGDGHLQLALRAHVPPARAGSGGAERGDRTDRRRPP